MDFRGIEQYAEINHNCTTGFPDIPVNFDWSIQDKQTRGISTKKFKNRNAIDFTAENINANVALSADSRSDISDPTRIANISETNIYSLNKNAESAYIDGDTPLFIKLNTKKKKKKTESGNGEIHQKTEKKTPKSDKVRKVKSDRNKETVTEKEEISRQVSRPYAEEPEPMVSFCHILQILRFNILSFSEL